VSYQSRLFEVLALGYVFCSVVAACSETTSNPDGGAAGRPTSSAGQASGGAGSAGTGQGGTHLGGVAAGGTTPTAGQAPMSGGAGGASGGQNSGGGGAQSGGTSALGGGGSGGSDLGEGGAGITVTNCTLESLHMKVSGGATFERTAQPADACGGGVGQGQPLELSFFLHPPELESTLLVSVLGPMIVPGTKGAFTPEQLSLLTTGAIWSIYQPDAEHPLACSVDLTTFEMTPSNRWHLAGSLNCPSPISGIGALAVTPLTIIDLKFSMLVDPS
jgi:hypothetical protein